MAVRISRALVWFIPLLVILAACGGGGGGDGSGSAGAGAAGGSSAPAAAGSLAISVTGLAAGVNAAITVIGAGSTQAVTASQTLANLSPGSYTIAAASVGSAGALYTAQNATQTVTIVAGGTANVAVDYASLRLALEEVATGLNSPLLATAPANDPRLFIVERAGTIRIMQNGALLATPFLDISSRISTTGEGGLLSMAFHPDYAGNGFFFVYLTDLNGDIAVERFQVSAADPNLADPTPLRIISIAHPVNTNHYGGLVSFGVDGFLYLGTGDGGGGGDPPGNAQNLNVLLGKLLRLDVSHASAAQPYVAPAANPFFGQKNKRGEIWAYGLRNPWRYAFDAATGLYIADVGQDRREEVNVANSAAGGVNYGWNLTEGTLCYPGDPCSTQGLTTPVLEYAHDAAGGCSITGGYVYRGSAIAELRGHYFYSDFCSGWLRSFAYVNGATTQQVDWNIANVGQILSFGMDAQKELYMLSGTGKVFRIVRGQ